MLASLAEIFEFGCGFAMMSINWSKGNLINADADAHASAHDPITFDARSRFRARQEKRLALSPGTGELTRPGRNEWPGTIFASDSPAAIWKWLGKSAVCDYQSFYDPQIGALAARPHGALRSEPSRPAVVGPDDICRHETNRAELSPIFASALSIEVSLRGQPDHSLHV